MLVLPLDSIEITDLRMMCEDRDCDEMAEIDVTRRLPEEGVRSMILCRKHWYVNAVPHAKRR